MKIGRRYIVTKASDDGMFEVGDDIVKNPDGSISSICGHGWIAIEHVTMAMVGVEYEIDKDWVERRKKKLLEELAELEK